MRPLRRTEHDTRVEIMPLIDVVFLLLTFFIYAMVLMVRVEVLPVPFESYISGETATPKPAISITIAIDGNVYIDTTVVTLDELVESVRSKLMDKPESVLYLVMEDGHSVIDRGPLLTGAWDRLRAVNLEVFLVGSPSEEKLDATP
ncbi:MAG TPA: biopolymer transporter ExbD [Phycisphaerales bacterium]|nr:biopolymer transporter ExbD [Phycisphaerales bacterium]